MLTRARVTNGYGINALLPEGVGEQFQDNDYCTVLGFLGMEDEVVIVAPRSGLVFTITYDEHSLSIEQ